MRRHWLARHLSVGLAVLFSLVIGEPGIIDACPIHGNIGLLRGEQSAPHAAAMHHGSAPSDQEHEACNCLGLCTSGAVVAVIPAQVIVPLQAEAWTVVEPEYATQSIPARTPRYSRPYTTGPPAA